MAQPTAPLHHSGGRAYGPGFDHSPLLVYYEMTRAGARGGDRGGPHPSELTTGDSRRLIDQLAEFPAPPMLVLTGGDPFERADLFEQVQHALWSGLDVSLAPSATRKVTRRAIRWLRDLGVSRLAMDVDGADAATHDAAHGEPGDFNRTLQILADARCEDLPTQVNTKITPSNAHRIAAMAQLMAQLRVGVWSVSFPVPVGPAAFVPRLSAQASETAFEQLWWQARHQPYAIKTMAAPHYRRYAIQHQISKSSGAGRRKGPSGFVPSCVNDGKGMMFVSHVGLIHPSGSMPIVCGLFPLDHVMHVYQNSPIFRGLRDAERLEGKCGMCEFRQICGGSRARAYAVTGNPFAQEPDCAYVPPSMS